MFRELLTDAPEQPDLLLSIAHVLKTLGRQQQAIESYRAAAAARPSFGDAYWSLANLKTYRFCDEEIGRMRVQEAASATSLADRYHLCFALGKALEDRAGTTTEHLFKLTMERGNSLREARDQLFGGLSLSAASVFSARYLPAILLLPGRVSAVTSRTRYSSLGCRVRVRRFWSRYSLPTPWLKERRNSPTFRGSCSGSPGAARRHSAPRYPAVLTELSSEQLRRLGRQYIDDTRIFRTGKPFFIDKMPNNFRHIGLIHLILPNAKIMDARREPMACCFSNFKQLFASGQDFTYSLRRHRPLLSELC